MPVWVGRVLGADDVVEQGLLVEVEVRRPAGVQLPQFSGQLEHVVRVAELAGVGDEEAGDGVRGPEVFRLAVAADGVGVRGGADRPRVGGDVAVAGRPGGLVLADGSDPLGHLRIGVQTAQLVQVRGEGVEDRRVVEPLGGGQPACVAGLLVEVGQYLVHAAELDAHQRLHRAPAERGGAPVDPVGEREEHVTSLRVADEAPHVEQTGHGLVDAVVRDVPVLQRACFEVGEVGLGEARQVAGGEARRGVVGLALGELGHQAVGLVAAGGVPDRGVGLGPCREEVALRMGAEGERRVVPSSGGGRGVGGEPVVGAEVVQQAVDVDEAEIGQGAVLIVEPAAAGEPDLTQVERERRHSDVGPDRGRLRRRGDGVQYGADSCGYDRDTGRLDHGAAAEGRNRHGELHGPWGMRVPRTRAVGPRQAAARSVRQPPAAHEC